METSTVMARAPRSGLRCRELAATTGLFLASCLVALGFAELAVRAAGLGVPRSRMASVRQALVTLDLYSENPRGELDVDLRDPATRRRYERIGFTELESLATSMPYGVECRQNATGFRDAPLGPKRAGARRVLVLGDSFTEGQGVREMAAFPRVLDQLLNQAEPGRWEVRNCGQRGRDLPALRAIGVLLLEDQPDVLLYAMMLNDAVQTPEFRARQAYLNDWILDRHHARMAEWRTRPTFRLLGLVRDRLATYRVGRATTQWYRDMYAGPNADGWRETQECILDMQRQAATRGCLFAVALWTPLVGLEGRDPFAAPTATIRSFCVRAGIPFEDLRPALAGHSSEALRVSPLDYHPNELAHRLAAERLAGFLRRVVAQPAR